MPHTSLWLGRVLHDPAFLLQVPNNQTKLMFFVFAFHIFNRNVPFIIFIKEFIFIQNQENFDTPIGTFSASTPHASVQQDTRTCATISEHCSLYEDSQAQLIPASFLIDLDL